MSVTDYYAVLGVSPTSEAIVIKAAFKALMLKYHPDTNKSADAAEKAQAINAAYAVLGDPDKRRAYDRQREAYTASPDVDDNSEATRQASSKSDRSTSFRSGQTQANTDSEAVVEDEGTTPSGRLKWKILASAAVISGIGILLINVSVNHEAEASSDSSQYPAVYESAEVAADGQYLAPQNILAESPPVISEADVLEGMDHFTNTFKNEGFFGVVEESRRCFEQASQSPSWQSIDRCEAYGAEADKFALSLYMTSGGPGADAFFGGKLSGAAASQYQALGQPYSFGLERTAQIKAVVSRLTSTVPLTLGDISDQLEAAAKIEASQGNGL